MSYKFVAQPLESGLYEPEGIYLTTPFAGPAKVLQAWGDHPEYYAQFKYNGVALHGHIGVDFGLPVGTALLAVDNGRVMEISFEPGGFERYVKLEHRWGESLYAHLGEVAVESGQIVERGELLGYSGGAKVANTPILPHLHFGIRVFPYNRFDGWGGFADPLPFLNPADLVFAEEASDGSAPFVPPPVAVEHPDMRRP